MEYVKLGNTGLEVSKKLIPKSNDFLIIFLESSSFNTQL